MSNLEMIECRFCDWTIAGDPMVLDMHGASVDEMLKMTGYSLTLHLIEKHPIKKYWAMSHLNWAQKKMIYYLFKEFNKTIRNEGKNGL